MAVEGPMPVKWTFEAAADLSAKQFHFVKLDADGKVVACSGLTDVPVGVLQNDPISGEEATVTIVGITKVVADAALNEADLIGPSADGQADARTIGTDTTHFVVGQMLTATGAAAEVGTAVVNCASPTRAA